MTENEIFLLRVLKNFLWNESCNISLGQAEAEALISLAERHGVLEIAVAEIGENLEKAVGRERFSQLKKEVMLRVSSQIQKGDELAAAASELRGNKISFVVFKGAAAGRFYENGDYRISADEDILVKRDELYRAAGVFEKRGYKIFKEKPSEIKLFNESLHYLTELHTEILDNDTGNINGIFTDELMCDGPYGFMLNGEKIPVFSPTAEMLSLIMHLFNHFTLGGIGIRQIMDTAACCKFYGNEINYDFIFSVSKQIKAERFTEAVLYLCRKYFCIDNNISFDEKIAAELITDILSAGVFGTAEKGRQRSAGLTRKAVAAGQNGLISVIKSLYPDDETMMTKYPELIENRKNINKYRLKRLITFCGEKDKFKSLAVAKRRKKLFEDLGILP